VQEVRWDRVGVQEVRWDRVGVQVRWDRVGLQGVRWDKGGTVRAEDYNFFYGKKNHQLGTGYFVHHRIVLAVRRVEFVSNRVSYII